jgi:4-amino-4-deoxy-L-arabinose transferase-like glycosyltransferase
MKAGAARTTLLIAGLCGLFLFTEWNWFGAPFERDEGEYAYSAWLMSHGGVPYRDAFLQKPPMILYTYWLAQRFSDSAVWPPRALAAVFVLLTAALIWWIARRQYGPRCAWISAWLFVPMIALPALVPLAANTEKFMNLPVTAVVALHLHGSGRRRTWIWPAAGACACLALLYKPICLPVLLFVFAAWHAETAWQTRDWRAAAVQAAWTAAGGAAVAVAAVAWFAAHGALGAMWESAVVFNQAYAASFGWSPSAFLRVGARLAAWWWPLILAAAWFLRKAPARWWYFSALLALALLAAYKDLSGHYYLAAVPFLAIVAGRGLDDLGERLARWRIRVRQPWLPAAAVLLLTAPVVPFAFSAPDRLVERTYTYNPFAESPLVARRLAQMTAPGDAVLVAGSEPQVLFYAKRRSASRFVIMYPLMLPTDHAPRYQEELLRTLREEPPETVLLSNSMHSWLVDPSSMPRAFLARILEVLRTEYCVVGGFVRKGDRKMWCEPLDPRLQEDATLILYRRNGGRAHGIPAAGAGRPPG